MPELPEVETLARGLRATLVGRTIQAAAVYWPRTVACPAVDEFLRLVRGRRVLEVGRRGKYLVIGLDRGCLLIHPKMSGRLRYVPHGEPPGPHTRLALVLEGGEELRFEDARKFGRAYLVDDPQQVTARLGPEPLADGFTLDDLRRLLARRSGRLKPLLTNQAFLAGVGNIYADEVLFLARLHPLRRADSLTSEEQGRLYRALRRVLAEAVSRRGTTLDDGGYVDIAGEAGAFQWQIAVYGRGGKPCPACGGAVQRIVVGGRSAHFCPGCQPEGSV